MQFKHIGAAMLLAGSMVEAKSVQERQQLGDLTSAYFYYCTPPPNAPVTVQPIVDVTVDITVNIYITVFIDVCPDIGICHLEYTLTQTCTQTSICHPPAIPLGFTITEKPCDVNGQQTTITVTEPCAASPPPNAPEWPPIPKQVPAPESNSNQSPPILLPPNPSNPDRFPPNPANLSISGAQSNSPEPYLPHTKPTQPYNPYLPTQSGMPQASPAKPPALPPMTASPNGPRPSRAERMVKNNLGTFVTGMLGLMATIMFTL